MTLSFRTRDEISWRQACLYPENADVIHVLESLNSDDLVEKYRFRKVGFEFEIVLHGRSRTLYFTCASFKQFELLCRITSNTLDIPSYSTEDEIQ